MVFRETFGANEMTNPYKDATHRLGDEYMAKDYMGRWCYIDADGNAWPAHSNDFEQIEKDAVPIEKEMNK